MKAAAPTAPLLVDLAAALFLAAPLGAQTASADRPASPAAFARMARVMMGPRCLNCHTVSGFPTQGDDRHRHLMNVMRGANGRGAPGMRCTTCHGRRNNDASGVPGANDDWRLAPLSMGWQGLSTRELCLHLKDPTRNGGRTGAEVVNHLRTPLVVWAWAPGTDAHGAARAAPAVSYAAFLAAAESWVTTGQVCPEPR